MRILDQHSAVRKASRARRQLLGRLSRQHRLVGFASLSLICALSFTIEAPAKGHPSPVAVAVTADGRRCATANYRSNSVTLVDLLRREVIAEVPCGKGPADLVWVDGQTLLIALKHEAAVAVASIHGARISIDERIFVGSQPCAIALGAPGSKTIQPRVFVALEAVDRVAVVDLTQKKVLRQIDVGQQPASLAVSPNGNWLVTVCSHPGEMLVHDTGTLELINRRTLLDQTGNVGLLAILPDSSASIVPHIVNRTFPVNSDNIEKGWVIDNRLSKLPLPAGEEWDQVQLGLDKRGDAVGDANAAALSPDGTWLLVTCGGTHELLIFRRRAIPWPPADPGDFIPDELLHGDGRFRRLELGGRPMGVEFIDPKTAVVANYLLDALQVVDVSAATLVDTIPLSEAGKPSLERRGETIFYDADRSLNSWFSCHTCHTDGHTSGLTFDTLNDGSYNTQKLTPSLRGVVHTAPWTWHGWQTSLDAAMKKSLRSTMQGRQPSTPDDVQALVAFLATLDYPSSPHRTPEGRITEAARRGKSLFEGKAGCVNCHRAPHFTTPETFDVGLGSSGVESQEYNPPPLRGIFARRRFLHDGRARSLRAVLGQHRPEDVGGEPLRDSELNDLLAYLMSL